MHRFENHPKKKQHHHRNRWKEESCDKNVIRSTNAVCILILAVIQLPICIGNNFIVKQIFVAKIILWQFSNILKFTILTSDMNEMFLVEPKISRLTPEKCLIESLEICENIYFIILTNIYLITLSRSMIFRNSFP